MSELSNIKDQLDTAAVYRLTDKVRQLRAFLPDAVIAGGAIRDALLSRETKDLDYLTEFDTNPEELERIFGIAFRWVNVNAVMYDTPDGNSGLRYVLESVDKRINVLVCSSVDRKLNSFPDDISMVWFDGEEIHYDPRFIRAVESKVVTFAERSRSSRLSRLQAKYGDEYEFAATADDIVS